MLSRVAESIYWMSRYIERAENVARVVGVNNRLRLDLPEQAAEQWDPMVQVSGDEPAFRARYDRRPARLFSAPAFDPLNPNLIVRGTARENARSVREVISSEMWEEVNRFYLFLSAPGASDRALANAHAFFQEIRRSSHLIEGTRNETMEHGEGWHFGEIGRQIERADQTTRILDLKYYLLLPSAADVGAPIDDLQWGALLRSASAMEAYRRAHGRIAAAAVAGFLLLDREFPRSVHHCTTAAQSSLHAVTGTPVRRFVNPAERSLGRLVAELDYTDVTDVIRAGLHGFLDSLQDRLNDIGDEITRTFFAPPVAPGGRG